MRLTSAGYLGIGTDSPGEPLHALGVRPAVALQNTGTTAKARFAGFAGALAYLASNVYYDGSSFQRDDTGAAAALLDVGPSAVFRVRWANAGANPISFDTFLYLTASGDFGIGCEDPDGGIEVSKDGAVDAVVSAFTAATARGLLTLRRARGTRASPAAIQSGDDLAMVRGRGYDGSAWYTGGYLVWEATENWSSTNRGTALHAYLVPKGSASYSEMLRLADSQLQVPVGSEGAPSYTFLGRTTDGAFSPAAGVVAWVTGEAERARLYGYSFDLGNYSGTAATLWVKTASGADAALKLREHSDNYGVTLVYDGGANKAYLKRHDDSEPGSVVLTLYRGDDRVRLTPCDTVPSVDGDISQYVTPNTLHYKLGGTVKALGGVLAWQKANQAGDMISGGAVSEAAFASGSYSVNSSLWVGGKYLRIVARGYSKITSNSQAARTITIRLRIGGLTGSVLADHSWTMAAGSSPTTRTGWPRTSLLLTARSPGEYPSSPDWVSTL